MQIFTHAEFTQHEVADGHPERADRLHHLLAHLDACGVSQDFPFKQPGAATGAAVSRAHDDAYLGLLESKRPDTGLISLDADTSMGPSTLSAALHAAGAVCQGVQDAAANTEPRSFCIVRPPGHHAERDAAMGFCILNSIAIGALEALQQPGIERVAVIDFDVHHGNGSVDILRDIPEILLCSSFQHPFYPHRFFENDWSNVINTPLPVGSAGAELRKAVEQQWLPALEKHRPDLILVSAGFDAHKNDPLAGLNWQEDDFHWITKLIVSLANQYSKGRIVSALEGGYDLAALASSVEAHLDALR